MSTTEGPMNLTPLKEVGSWHSSSQVPTASIYKFLTLKETK